MKLGNLDEKTPLSIKIIVFLVAYNLLIILLGGWKKLQILFVPITGLPAILLTFAMVIVLSLILLGLIYRTEWGRKLAIAINVIVILSTVATILFAFGALLLNQDATRLAKSTILDLIIGLIGGLLYVTFFFGMLDISSLIVAGASIYYLKKYKAFFDSNLLIADKKIVLPVIGMAIIAIILATYFTITSTALLGEFNLPSNETEQEWKTKVNSTDYTVNFKENSLKIQSLLGTPPSEQEFKDFMKTLIKDTGIKTAINEYKITANGRSCAPEITPITWKTINNKEVGIKICLGADTNKPFDADLIIKKLTN